MRDRGAAFHRWELPFHLTIQDRGEHGGFTDVDSFTAGQQG
jgi:hypothetical protein